MAPATSLSPELTSRFRSTIRSALSLLIGLLIVSTPATAFEQLTQAQTLIYDTAHLANTSSGQSLHYRFEMRDEAGTLVHDEALMTILDEQGPERRDVELDFLSAERHLPLPTFTAYRGNPIIIVMLEHLAQSMGAATGGGTLYFRNRIRDALAEAELAIDSGTASLDGKEVTTRSVRFAPFLEDTMLEPDSPYRQAEFTLRFSDQLPAGLLDIRFHARSDDAEMHRSLSLDTTR